METEYLDEEQVIALYNKVRTGKRTWPTGIWTSPAALQYAVTVFDYWIHNVMGWKGWPEARGKVTPALLEEHRLADLVESVFVPEFGDDWLDFEIVLNESMRLSEDEAWAPDVADRQERVEAAFEHAFEQLIGSSKQQPKLLPTYHRFRNHPLRMWSAFQEAQGEADKAGRESGVDLQRRRRAPRRGQRDLGRAASLLSCRPRRRHRGRRLGAGDLPSRAGDPGRGAGNRELCRVAQRLCRRVLPLRRLRRAAQPVRRGCRQGAPPGRPRSARRTLASRPSGSSSSPPSPSRNAPSRPSASVAAGCSKGSLPPKRRALYRWHQPHRTSSNRRTCSAPTRASAAARAAGGRRRCVRSGGGATRRRPARAGCPLCSGAARARRGPESLRAQS